MPVSLSGAYTRALLMLAIPAVAFGQEASPLRKSDLIRLLTGTTYTKGEVAAIVRRSCLAFTPTAHDRRSLRELGATTTVMREVDACARRRESRSTTAGSPARAPTRLLEVSLAQQSYTATAGSVASVRVELRRGGEAASGVPLVLRGATLIPGGARQDLWASTDARGQAVFAVPAGTAAGTHRLLVSAGDTVPLRGNSEITLATLPATPTVAELTPAVLTVGRGTKATRDVVVVIRDGFGNPVPKQQVQLRPTVSRPALIGVTGQTSDSGVVRFQLLATTPLRDGDAFDVVVGGRSLATLRVSAGPAPTVSTVAAGRAANLFLQAAHLAASGRHAAAEATYDSVLQVDSTMLAARLGRAYVRSWQRKDSLARADFLAVLQADSSNVAALTGLGYSYAWAGDYDKAEARFRQALRVAPQTADADRGLAYVAMWRGDANEAVRRFEGATRRHPQDAESQVGLGQALLAAGDPGAARDAFKQALRLDPQRTDARQGLEVARGVRRRPVELYAWGGLSAFSADASASQLSNSTSDVGLRFAEVAYWPTRMLRLSFQYDNGLTHDNLTLVREGTNASAYLVGAQVDLRGGPARVDIGVRDLPAGESQMLVRGEKAFFLSGARVAKVGAWIGPRSDNRTEWLTHAGFGFPASRHLRLEPTFFYSRDGTPGASEFRALLYSEYLFDNGWKLGGGLAGGVANRGSLTAPALEPSPIDTSDGLWDAYVLTEAPVAAQHIQLLLRHQQIIGGPGLTIVALGFALGL
jgi:tetratricopeptide (TPR) repeat protein